MTAILSDVYLSQAGQVILDANGNGLITFSPAVGQYWRPSIVHVGSLTGSAVTADVHVGAAPATRSGTAYSDPSSIKDSTPLGADDTTGILSGTVVFPGQTITVHFRNGQINDQCIAEVIGLSSPQPPPYGNLPEIPGVRFAGSVFNPQSPHGVLSISEGVTLGVGQFVNAFPQGTAVNATPPQTAINVDAFTYIAFNLAAIAGLNLNVVIGWFTDATALIQVANDEFSLLNGDALDMSIPVKASYLSVQFQASATNGGVVVWTISGAQVGYQAQETDSVNVLIQLNGGNLGTGLTNTLNATQIMPGPAVVTAYSDTASATYDLQLVGVHFDGTVVPILRGSQLHPFFATPVYLPAMHIRLVFHNSSAGTIFTFVFLNAKPIFP